MNDTQLSSRKADHIELAFSAQTLQADPRFYYEPMAVPHPTGEHPWEPLEMAGRRMLIPWWISSMTGGEARAKYINERLATAAAKYGLGMGLGSCRPVLEDPRTHPDFAVRKFLGDQPLMANLGVAQLEHLAAVDQLYKVVEMVKSLEADGLIVHINPLQEWAQPEGDRLLQAPIDTLKRVMDAVKLPLMVKEVGQGFGPKSLKALLELPLEAVEFGAYGGTNFALIEAMRASESDFEGLKPAAELGHTAEEMGDWIRQWSAQSWKPQTRVLVASGGLRHFLDGYYHLKRLPGTVIYAQAWAFLKPALQSQEALNAYCESQIKGLQMAHQYLDLRE
ncbi:MAG: isopentenyl-diphosphate delta-isomerase [Bacteroidia bacterium]